MITTATAEWSAPQACAECGTDAAYVRHAHGEAICRTCGHENPMDRWNLDAGERFEWVGGECAEWPAVLYVTRYNWLEDETSAYV